MREMKDSGVAWIGKIPHCWNTSKLKYLGQYINGYAFKPEEWGSKGVPIIRIQDLTGSNDNPNYFEGQIDKKYWVENGDILISWAATLDAFIWNKGNGWLNQHIFKAVPNRRIINYDFFFWMIKESMKNMNNDNKHGIFMQHVTLSVFNNFTIPMPPLAEQERIAAFLDAECAEIDTVLEKTRASIEEYKKLKQAIITQSVTKGIRGDRPMKDSGIEWIGDIPVEWDVIRVKQLLKERNERSKEGKEEPLSMSQKVGLVPTKFLESIPNMASSFVGAKLAYVDDLVFNKLKAHLGVFSVSRYDGLVSPDYAVYCSTGKSNLKYLEYIFKTPQCIGEFRKKSTGIAAGLMRLYTEGLFSIYLPYPALSEQEEIAEYLNEKCAGIDALIVKKQQYLIEIENYKKSLIYEYVTGKKEVV
ncbi:MAG: restriction endonuclease subunit S [Oscillospiraceae bacterium]